MKKEIILCDNCKRIIAEEKCDICKMDLCKECFDEGYIKVLPNKTLTIKICPKCKQLNLTKDNCKEIKELIIKRLRDSKIFEGLENEEKEKEIGSWLGGVITVVSPNSFAHTKKIYTPRFEKLQKKRKQRSGKIKLWGNNK